MVIQKRLSDLTDTDWEGEKTLWHRQQQARCSIKPLWKQPKAQYVKCCQNWVTEWTDSFLEALNKAVDAGIKQMRTELAKVVSENLESAERRCKLITMPQLELLEAHNGRDNIRSVGVKEDRSSDKVNEGYSQSMQNVLQ